MNYFLNNHPIVFAVITIAIVFWCVIGGALFLDKFMSPLNNWNRRQTIFAAIVGGPLCFAIMSLAALGWIATFTFLYIWEKLR